MSERDQKPSPIDTLMHSFLNYGDTLISFTDLSEPPKLRRQTHIRINRLEDDELSEFTKRILAGLSSDKADWASMKEKGGINALLYTPFQRIDPTTLTEMYTHAAEKVSDNFQPVRQLGPLLKAGVILAPYIPEGPLGESFKETVHSLRSISPDIVPNEISISGQTVEDIIGIAAVENPKPKLDHVIVTAEELSLIQEKGLTEDSIRKEILKSLLAKGMTKSAISRLLGYNFTLLTSEVDTLIEEGTLDASVLERLTPYGRWRRRKIVELTEHGILPKSIAKQLDISISTVNRELSTLKTKKTASTTRKGGGRHSVAEVEERRQMIIDAAPNAYTLAEIAKTLGLDYEIVLYDAKELRSQGKIASAEEMKEKTHKRNASRTALAKRLRSWGLKVTEIEKLMKLSPSQVQGYLYPHKDTKNK